MKRIAIFLRDSGSVNRFRRAILATLRVDAVNEGLLCSGFFQDDPKFSAGAEFDLISHRQCSQLCLTTVGLYSYSWKNQYSSFGKQLATANACQCFSVKQKRIPGMGWHAKVFIAKAAGKPVAGVIGSSNITRRAFGEFRAFNRECDVVMWDETVPQIQSAIEDAIGNPGDASDVLVANYDENHRANRRSLADRLLSLEAEILEKAIDLNEPPNQS